MKLGQVAREGYRTVLEMERYVRSNVDNKLLFLIQLRASVLNGCAYCVDSHSHDLFEAGENVQRVLGVTVWPEFPYFTPQERAALALTDAVTRLDEDGVPDEVWAGAEEFFTEKEIADLILAIGTINVWNRIGVSTRMRPPLRK
ncbi:carboxymuconolactone decarboxylase family protein [Streptomyces sp. NBC_01136]|uniref:carboxymuconolactone decarboxylase family protein n=1 Tax=unclassified Streptomyces TaxID=2593676 RepID=UPI0032441C2C|nr:carboxymuconolactone decarboxylase family protein [Streptomyces sp. NBC_01136]